MKDFWVQIKVKLKEGILDPEAEAIQRGLGRLDFQQVEQVQRGKIFRLQIKAETGEQAVDQAREMATKLLVNLVMEDFEVRLEE